MFWNTDITLHIQGTYNIKGEGHRQINCDDYVSEVEMAGKKGNFFYYLYILIYSALLDKYICNSVT